MTTEERRGLALVALAVCAFSASPVLVRWAAASVSALEISAGRLLVAGIAIFAVNLLRARATSGSPPGHAIAPTRAHLPRFAFFGFVAALHFFFYAYSLEFTSIAHSLAIMYTAPIWVALFSRFTLAEPLSPRKWLGILVAVLGVAVLTGFAPARALLRPESGVSLNVTPRVLVGDLLALGAALAFAVYSVVGRSQRQRYPLLVYAGSVYLLAALWLLPAAAVAHAPGSLGWPAVASIVALGIVPLACGHTLYNAALRRTKATYVNLIATLEVAGGTLLGALLLREIPPPDSIAGGLITILGILIVLL